MEKFDNSTYSIIYFAIGRRYSRLDFDLNSAGDVHRLKYNVLLGKLEKKVKKLDDLHKFSI